MREKGWGERERERERGREGERVCESITEEERNEFMMILPK